MRCKLVFHSAKDVKAEEKRRPAHRETKGRGPPVFPVKGEERLPV